jgi:hypothetical protein
MLYYVQERKWEGMGLHSSPDTEDVGVSCYTLMNIYSDDKIFKYNNKMASVAHPKYLYLQKNKKSLEEHVTERAWNSGK